MTEFDKKGQKKAPLTLLLILSVGLVLIGGGALAVSLGYYFSLANKPATEDTVNEVFYETVPQSATPLQKEVPEEDIDYEEPTDLPPIKLLNVPYINQRSKYPTGCESISAVMALNFAGYDITPEDFIDNYLPQSPTPYIDENGRLYGYNPSRCFLGSPYSAGGWGCYYPVIGRCLNKIVDTSRHDVVNLHNVPLNELTGYIDKGTPVIIWATQSMNKPKKSQTWTLVDDDRSFTWVSPNHCLLLVGYDSGGYYFNDPLTHKNCRYPADIVEKRYKSMGKQALAIVENTAVEETNENQTED